MGAAADFAAEFVFDNTFVGVLSFSGFYRDAEELIKTFGKGFGVDLPLRFGFIDVEIPGIGGGSGEGGTFLVEITTGWIG